MLTPTIHWRFHFQSFRQMKKQEQTYWKSNKQQPIKQMLYIYIYMYVYMCVCVCARVFLPSNQNQRGDDVTGWKGGLQNECQFIEAQPRSHNQHVLYLFEWWRNSIYFWLRNLEWWEWKSTYTKYQGLMTGKWQQCYFCLMPDINKNKLFFRFK